MAELRTDDEMLISEATAKEMLEEMKKQSAQMAILAGNQVSDMVTDFKSVLNIIRQGIGPRVFDFGDKINVPWKNGETQYDNVFDIMHHGKTELSTGENLPAMTIMQHFATPIGIPFDSPEAFKYVEKAEISPGTYNITMGFDWGTYVKKGETYQFTLTKSVPIGGQMAGFERAPDVDPKDWKVSTYATVGAFDAIETVSVTKGNAGTNLGTFTTLHNENLRSFHCVAYGYNRYSMSAIRQWLNGKGKNWWKPQHNWDRPPAEAKTVDGYLTGFSEEFLSIIKPTKIRTALNTTTDKDIATYEDVYDLFFLPSLQNLNINTQISDVEGETWGYWPRALGRNTKVPWYKTYEEGGFIKFYALNAQTSALTVRLRSASRGYGSYTWTVYVSGYVTNFGANWASRCTPACKIC